MEAAKTQFKAGEVIVGWTKPFVKVLSARETGKRCANCFKPPHGVKGLSQCAACKISCYCSKKCQKEDWKFAHSVECKSTLFHNPLTTLTSCSFLGPMPTIQNMSFIVARILAHLKLHPEKEHDKQELWDGSKRSFSDLMSHVDDGDLPADHLAKQMSNLIIHEDFGWTAEYVRRILGIWKINAFELLDEGEEETIGGALHIQTSVFNHSCRPNALRVINSEYCMQIRCIADIPEGLEPVITYLAGIYDREERQNLLKRYSFDCACDLCEEELRGGPAINYDFARDFENNIFKRFATTMSPFKALMEDREKGIRLFETLFHRYDHRITKCAVWSFNSYAESENNMDWRLSEFEKRVFAKKLADDTLRRLEITYGKEYHAYKVTKARMILLGIKIAE